MLEGENLDDVEGADKEEFNILEQLNKLSLEDTIEEHHDFATAISDQDEAVGVSEAARSIFNPNNPIFGETHLSSKVDIIINC